MGEDPPPSGVVTKIFHLQHVSASEVLRLLESQGGRGGGAGAGAIEETNHLIVTDTAENIRRIAKIVDEIDRPGLAEITEVLPLKFAGAAKLAEALNSALAESESRGDRLKQRLPSVPGRGTARRRVAAVVPSPHSNSLVLVGTAAQIAELKRLIAKMDVDQPMGSGRFNAIFLKYLSAEEAANQINALLTKSTGKDGTAAPRAIAIEASPANNALLVDATPGDQEMVRQLVEKLDQVPEQVLITLVIAELAVSENLNVGVELMALDMPSDSGSTVVQGSTRTSEGTESLMNAVQTGLFPRGITIGLATGTRIDDDGKVVVGYPAMINLDALKKNARFKILSETALEAQNNREATVSIVNEIPILKSTIQGGSGTSRDVIQNIERVDVGIRLKLTPHVIPGGDVRMDLNPSIEAVIDPGPAGTPFTPTIARREVSTTVTVPSGKTIIIAGLTREDKTMVKTRVPILGSIPLLGVLFRHNVEGIEKTNLLIYVTPRIVTDVAAAEQVVDEWETKTGLQDHEESPLK